jgi:hypothetical protein
MVWRSLNFLLHLFSLHKRHRILLNQHWQQNDVFYCHWYSFKGRDAVFFMLFKWMVDLLTLLICIVIPPATKLWGIYWNRVVHPSIFLSICPSVCRRNGFRALEHYPYHLDSPYLTYGLPMGGRCSLLILRSKGRRSSALEIKVEIRFPGSRPLSLPPRVTTSHISHGRKMFPIDFEVKRSKVKHTVHQSRNMVSGL